MDLEGDKEGLEKRLEEEETQKKELETQNAALATSLKEKEQRMSLMEAAKEGGEARTKELEEELLRKCQEVTRVLEEDSRDAQIAGQLGFVRMGSAHRRSKVSRQGRLKRFQW